MFLYFKSHCTKCLEATAIPCNQFDWRSKCAIPEAGISETLQKCTMSHCTYVTFSRKNGDGDVWCGNAHLKWRPQCVGSGLLLASSQLAALCAFEFAALLCHVVPFVQPSRILSVIAAMPLPVGQLFCVMMMERFVNVKGRCELSCF